jgi:hypothetical protein
MKKDLLLEARDQFAVSGRVHLPGSTLEPKNLMELSDLQLENTIDIWRHLL